MRRYAVLGPEEVRIKTDMRLPAPLHARMSEMAKILGVPMNAILAIAIASFSAKLAGILPEKSRKTLVKDIQDIFTKVLAEIKK